MSSSRDPPLTTKHRQSPSLPAPPSPSHSPQPNLSQVPRFALIHDLATGTRTHAPIKYLFANEPHPPVSITDRTRTLVVDLSAEADKVEGAQSLSGEWQLVSAQLGTSARITSVDGGGGSGESTKGSTVLNIEGMGQFSNMTRGGTEDVFDLARQFSERYVTFS
jgi:hypothetical protein